MQLQFKE